jgi:hypothetical protein
MSKSNPHNLDPITDVPGAHPVGVGAGAAAGASLGAAFGAAAGPIGMAIGAIAGGVVGGLSGKEIAEQTNPTLGGAPEEHKIESGIGATVGTVAGGILGVAGGPVGVVALGAAGAAVGDWVGGSVGRDVFPDEEDARWRGLHGTRPYHAVGYDYDDYRPAYAMGHAGRSSGKTFDESETELSHSWEKVKGKSRLTWAQAKLAARDAWHDVKS